MLRPASIKSCPTTCQTTRICRSGAGWKSASGRMRALRSRIRSRLGVRFADEHASDVCAILYRLATQERLSLWAGDALPPRWLSQRLGEVARKLAGGCCKASPRITSLSNDPGSRRVDAHQGVSYLELLADRLYVPPPREWQRRRRRPPPGRSLKVSGSQRS